MLLKINMQTESQKKGRYGLYLILFYCNFKTAMGLKKKLSQLMDCPLHTNNTHKIVTTNISHKQIQIIFRPKTWRDIGQI